MNTEAISSPLVAERRWLYRVAGISALLFGLAYIIIFPIYAGVGAPPAGGEAWLEYAAGKTAGWWTILALSILTDILLIPIALALYFALRTINHDMTLVGAAFVVLFVGLDLAVTWSNYAALISLAESYQDAASEADRAVLIPAASYASAVLKSPVEGVYAIATLGVGLLLIGLVMRRSVFGTATGYIAIVTGILALISVLGGLVISELGLAVILASILTTVWALLVGYRLYRLSQT